jgi:hypothetical protein
MRDVAAGKQLRDEFALIFIPAADPAALQWHKEKCHRVAFY